MEHQKDIKVLFKEALQHEEKGQYRLALRRIRKVLDIEPNNEVAKKKIIEIQNQFDHHHQKIVNKEKKNITIFIVLIVFIILAFIFGSIISEY